MKIVLRLAIAMVVLTLVGGAILAQSGNDLFQQALVKERTEGKLPEAIKLYQTIADKYRSDHKLAAKALFQIGQAYEKLGNPEARDVYKRIAREFPDQKDVAADAGRRLAVLSRTPKSDELTQRPLGFSAERGASITPDGRWVAQPATGDGITGVGITIRETATGRVIERASGSITLSPVLSPDQKQIAYVWKEPLRSKEVSSLRVMPNVAGAKPQVLLDNKEYDFIWVEWFPDGESILGLVRRPDQTWQLLRVRVTDRSFKVIKSLEWRVLSIAHRPSISPDGRYITYAAFANNPSSPGRGADSTGQHIYLLPADGSGPEADIVNTASLNERPLWTPDGTHIVFVSDVSGTNDLWSVAVSNGKATAPPQRVMSNMGELIFPIGITRDWSYYYTRQERHLAQVSVAELAPGGGRVVDTFPGGNPAWSPDGRMLAFLRNTARPGEVFDLVVRSFETNQERTFSVKGIAEDPPRWFHDGKRLLILAAPDGNNQWWSVLDLQTKNVKQVSRRSCRPMTPILPGEGLSFEERRNQSRESCQPGIAAISPDDKTLYTVVKAPNSNLQNRIVAIDLTSGQERQILELPDSYVCSAITLSRDGRTLAIVKSRRNESGGGVGHQIGLVGVDKGDYRGVHKYSTTWTADRLEWSENGRSLLFAIGERLMRISIDGGEPEFTGLSVDNAPTSTFDLSPDGSRVAFGKAARAEISGLLAIDNLSAALKNSK